jgi:hypothetical protein
MNRKWCGRNRSWPNFKALYRHYPWRDWEKPQNLVKNSRCPGRDLSPDLTNKKQKCLLVVWVVKLIMLYHQHKCTYLSVYNIYNRNTCSFVVYEGLQIWHWTLIILRFILGYEPVLNSSVLQWRKNLYVWDFKFSRRRVWSSELSSGVYCRVK